MLEVRKIKRLCKGVKINCQAAAKNKALLNVAFQQLGRATNRFNNSHKTMDADTQTQLYRLICNSAQATMDYFNN